MSDCTIPSRTQRGIVLALTAVVLAGCHNPWLDYRRRNAEAIATYPEKYRTDILALMRTYLNDPVQVRDAFISEPALRTLENTERYTVCVRYNARKSPGQYAGSKDSMALFVDGRLDRMVDNARMQCRDAAYTPFPELEQLTR